MSNNVIPLPVHRDFVSSDDPIENARHVLQTTANVFAEGARAYPEHRERFLRLYWQLQELLEDEL